MKLSKMITVAIAAHALVLGHAGAQTGVPKQIKIVVPFSAGASNDALARAISPLLAEKLKTIVIVENKVGAAGAIGADFVARAEKDGSVLLLTSSTFLTSAVTQPKLPFDPVKSFTPIAMIGDGPMVVAATNAKNYQSFQSLLDAARANPGALNYGTAGVGSVGHLATVMMDDSAKINMTHVPYKGAANAAADMAGGQIDVMLSNYSSIVPLVHNKKVKLLATTDSGPNKAFPELPPANSLVPGFSAKLWVGIFAPAGVSENVVKSFNQSLGEASKSPEVARLLDMDGFASSSLTGAQFGQRVADDLVTWKAIAEKHHITME